MAAGRGREKGWRGNPGAERAVSTSTAGPGTTGRLGRHGTKSCSAESARSRAEEAAGQRQRQRLGRERRARDPGVSLRQPSRGCKAPLNEEGEKTKNENIILKVTGQDGSVVHFRIKRHTPLSKLMKAYCCRQGLSVRHITFLFDGQPIREADTPAQLEMEHEDTIEVYHQQTGGDC